MIQTTQQLDPFASDVPRTEVSHPTVLGFDMVAIYSALLRSRWWMLAIVFATLTAGIALTLLSTPIYQAAASVQINQEREKVLGTESKEDVVSLQDAERFLQTQLDVLRSRTTATAVADEMNLFNNDEFLTAMGEESATNPGPRQTLEEARREQVIRILQDNLSLNLPVDSRVVQIGFQSSDPRLAARIANSFADSFIRSNLQRRFDSSSYARDFLREQLQEAQLRLEKSERAAVDYARRTNIVDTSGSNGDANRKSSSLTVDSLVELNQKLATVMADRIEAESRWNRVRSIPVLNIPQVQSNEAIQRLVQQKAELEALYSEESERRKEDYPSMRRAAARISQLESEILQLAGAVRQGVKSNYDVAREQENSLRAQVNDFRQQSQEEQTDSIQLSILQREADTSRQQYEFLLRRYNELAAEAGVQSNNLSVVDRAVSPADPVSPNIILNLLGALVLGSLLALVFAIARETLFNMIRTPDDVSRGLHIPVLGAVPDGGDAMQVRDELSDPKSIFYEAINSIRTSLLLSSRSGLPKSIAFTSTQPGEGKSTTCFSLAYALVRSGRKVLVIDADLRRPNQHRIFGIENVLGMSDLLAGGIDLQSAIRKDAKSGVDVITAGPIPPNPSELIETNALKDLIARCHEFYDCVLIDCPPILGLADAIVAASAVDGVIYIAESGRNHSRGALTSVQRLRGSGAHIVGAIITRFEADASGYGNAYAYAYTYSADR
ncbi:polysaccharide biosynthesis tyrosine autokinase [Sphingopyxis sp. 2PD]|uniref:GumC family protein n=1 Tax=Sphingopyxis sp. 2PD TaxID=2502196 RepID=UPI0010F5148D|nr:polysaccharide biosynthesis tyrosine autokinase [Sphingopyxis sp. 2PD]